MKLALLADIHSNYVALEECLKYIENNSFDGVVYLGDYITDCPYPQKTIELVKQTIAKYRTWCIRGNREDYMINHRPESDEWVYKSQTGSLLYTYENLSEDDLSFLKAMPISRVIEIDGCKPFMIAHGSPTNSRDLLKANTDLSNEWLDKIDTDYMFCGHSHRPFVYEYNGKTLVNCGTVGMPTNHQSNSQFTQIEFIQGKWDIKLISLPYDIDKVLSDFEESGVFEKYHWWAKLIAKCLQTGVNYSVYGLRRALVLADESGEELNESHWEQAAKEFGIE